MKLTIDLWQKALLLYNTFESKGEKLGRKRLEEALQVSERTARLLLFALENRHIIKTAPSLFEPKKKTLVLSDPHIPFHDGGAIETALHYGEEAGVDTIVLLGDILDFYEISTFRRKKTKPHLEDEIKETKNFLSDLRKRFPDARIIYKEGNHEERFQKYIITNAEKIASLVEGLLQSVLGLPELNIEYIIKPFRIGKLWFLHGHERAGGSYNPEYITNVMWKYIHDHFIVGHYHRTQQKIFRKITEEFFWGGAVGWLGRTVSYADLTRFNQGFAIIEFNKKGEFRANNYTIINGEVF